MPAAAVTRMPMQDTSDIDVGKTVGLLTGLVTLSLILRALFKPLWEKVVYLAMKERCERYDKATELAETNADKLSALEAAVMAQGTALRDMPRLITTTESLCETISKLDDTLQQMDKDVREMGEWRQYVQGMWDGQERRKSQRREDDR